MQIPGGTALARAIEEAREALQTGDFERAANGYRRALSDSMATQELRSRLRVEHVGQLLHQGHPGYLETAIRQAQHYLEEPETRQDRPAFARLRVLLAGALISAGDEAQFRSTLDGLSAIISDDSDAQSVLRDSFPHYLRLRGLAAEQRADFEGARADLRRALTAFKQQNAAHACKTVEEDLQRIALQEGNQQMIAGLAAVAPETIQTLSQALIVVRALRRQGRYEQALQILRPWQTSTHTEPSQRFTVLFESALLSYCLGQRHLTATEVADLEKAAQQAIDPKGAKAILRRVRLFDQGLLFLSSGEGFAARLYDARMLILQEKLEEAEHILRSIKSQTAAPLKAAYWAIAAAELFFVRGWNAPHTDASRSSYARESLAWLRKALELSQALQVKELPGYILRLSGHVSISLLHDHGSARDQWAQANAYENLITSRQSSDEARVRYRESVPSQHDEMIMITADQAAAAASSTGAIPGEHVASVIVAMETARALTLLKLVQQPGEAQASPLPLPENRQACWHWYTDLALDIPADTALWLLHATPSRIYHGIICRNSLSWLDYPANKHDLSNLIAETGQLWISEENLQASTHNSPQLLPQYLTQIAASIHLQEVVRRIREMPNKIGRLVIVAGEDLSDIPFAALPMHAGERSTFLVEEFAVSYMLCASAVQPFIRRAKSSRGDRALVVQPPAEDLHVDISNHIGRRTQALRGAEATLPNLYQTLRKTSFPIVRFDCHGQFDPDKPAESFLRLSPSPTDDGRLTRDHLQPDQPQQPKISFHQCGTVMMGACDTAMFERLQREERLGLIRSAVAAGASSVVAARWKAEDITTNVILRQFQSYLRYLPRDIALQRAQLDILYGRSSELHAAHPKSGRILEHPDHPSRWACFVLYGDAGLQTRAPLLVRRLRQWRAHDDGHRA